MQLRDPSFGVMKNDLLYCNHFPCSHLDERSRHITSFKTVPSQPFVLELFHAKCQNSWFACTLCPAVRTQYSSKKTLKHHLNSVSHINKATSQTNPPNTPDNTPLIIDHVIVNNNDHEFYVPINDIPGIPPEQSESRHTDTSISARFPYCSTTQSSYFHNEQQSNDPLGYLVSKALFNNGLMKNELTDQDIELHMTLSTLCISMTKDQKEKQAKFLHILNVSTKTYPNL